MQISTVGGDRREHQPPSSPAAEAWALMFELIHLSKRRFMAIASRSRSSPPQVMALRQLDPDEPKPMSELALALAGQLRTSPASSTASKTAASSSAARPRTTGA